MSHLRVSMLGGLMCLLAFAPACRTGSSGGGGGTIPCALDGTCPQGYTCVNTVCLFGDVSASPDVAPSDTAKSDAGGSVDAGPIKDVGVGALDSGGSDVGMKDAGMKDAGPADAGGSDAGSGQDVLSGAPQKIVALQSGATSLQCPDSGAPVTVTKELLVEDAVATSKAVLLSGKHGMFYVRPLASPPVDGKYAGLKVVVFDSLPAIAAGDVVRITGDLVEYYCESEITIGSAPDAVAVVGKQAPPQAWKVAVQDIAWNNVGSEAYEGVLVRIEGAQVVEANILGTDGKAHGLFGVAPMGSAPGAGPMVQVGGSSETNFTVYDSATKRTTTTFSVGQGFKSITGHLTYSFGAYVLRVQTDADLVAQ